MLLFLTMTDRQSFLNGHRLRQDAAKIFIPMLQLLPALMAGGISRDRNGAHQFTRSAPSHFHRHAGFIPAKTRKAAQPEKRRPKNI
jgi:hypothetical protein